ncbi:MAG: phosphatase PAP2 family protein [Bacteroidales bacterium]|nr:phosphatase PAP2 family protein [Bacteroidales bacterium]
MTFFEQLHHLDKDVTLAINSVSSQAGDFVWMAFSNKYIWFALYAAVFVFLIRNTGWKKALVSTAAIVLTIVLCDQLGNVCKDFFQRLRPCCDLDMLGRGLRVLDPPYSRIEYGFYSAHAANAMGFAVSSIMAFKNDRRRNYGTYNVCITVWALLVGLSRVFVGKHFFGDVCAGFVAGIVIALAIGFLANRINGRIK